MKRSYYNLLAFLLMFNILFAFQACDNSEEPQPVSSGNNQNPGGSGNDNGDNNGNGDNNNGGSTIDGCQFPIASILSDSTYNIEIGGFFTTADPTDVYTVFGYSFTVEYSGKINELGIKVPEAGEYIVRIYLEDPMNNDVLAEAVIETQGPEWTYTAITPLDIQPDIMYQAAVYFEAKPDEKETRFFIIQDGFSYPQTNGDVTIERYGLNTFRGELEKPEPKDPALFPLHGGFVDFCFEAD